MKIKAKSLIIIIILLFSLILYLTKDSLFGFLLLGVIIFFIGFFSTIFIHELSHLITIKLNIWYNSGKRDIQRILNKPLWKQPCGIVWLSGYIGNVFYLIFLIRIFNQTLTGQLKIPFLFFFCYGAIICSIIAFFTIPKQFNTKFGDIYHYISINKIIQNGCECGNHNFLIGGKIKCTKCRKDVFEFKYYFEKSSKGFTPNHLNPLYLLSEKSKEFEASIDIKADPIIVYNYYKSDFSEIFMKKFKISNYKRKSDNEVSYLNRAFLIHSKIKNSIEPEKIEYEYLDGTDVHETIITLKKTNGYTNVFKIYKLPFYHAKLIIERNMMKQLKFNKKEIESQMG